MDERARYDDIAGDLEARNADVELGQMMGMPCIKVGGKMVAGFWRGEMTFKLPDAEQREAALVLAGAKLFDPSDKGRPMREWVQVPAKHAAEWRRLAETAVALRR